MAATREHAGESAFPAAREMGASTRVSRTNTLEIGLMDLSVHRLDLKFLSLQMAALSCLPGEPFSRKSPRYYADAIESAGMTSSPLEAQ